MIKAPKPARRFRGFREPSAESSVVPPYPLAGKKSEAAAEAAVPGGARLPGMRPPRLQRKEGRLRGLVQASRHRRRR